MSRPKVLFNWSGGKDSALALHYLQTGQEHTLAELLTSVNTAHDRISMHGVRRKLLYQQAQSIGIPLRELLLPESPDMEEYNALMENTMDAVKAAGITHSAFGDIFLEDLKQYREAQLAKVGLKAIFPLWQRDTRELMEEFLELGFKTVVVCAKAELESLVGRVIDQEFLNDLPAEVDPCGENGEFHTFVFEGPIFQHSIPYTLGEKVYREYDAPKKGGEEEPKKVGFYFQDLLPQ